MEQHLKFSIVAASIFVALINLTSCGGGGGSSAPPPVTLQSVAVTPGAPMLSVGAQQQLAATGTYSDNTTKDLTAMATWTSSSSSVAKVASGVVTGVSPGSATIVASYSGVSGNDSITVPNSTWTSAAAAPSVLAAQTATLLNDGTVLVDGSDPYQSPPGAAIYDPTANSWSATGATATARNFATSTLLLDGRVLVAGGTVENTASQPGANQSFYLASTELYDPTTKTWSAGADLPGPRELQTAVLLPDGKVLLAGGDDGHNDLLDAVVYDPATNTWTSVPTSLTIGGLPTAAVLQSGKVIVTASVSPVANSVIFDPTAGTWANGPSMNNVHLLGATATLLSDGRVLVAGGVTAYQQNSPMSVPEIYDPVANSWSLAGTMVTSRVAHTATLLLSGKVLITGGFTYPGPSLSSTELYDPSANTWSAGPDMASPRDHHGAVLLPSGPVFVTGGQNQGAALLSSEVYR
jgi:N-acetylneuraminic acid mutarotase